MLNMSVAPSIKAPAGNPAAMPDSGLLGASEPVSEEFSNILEREVSQTADSHQQSTNGNNAKTKEQPKEAETTTAENVNAETAKTAAAENPSSFIQNLLTDPTLGFRPNQSIDQLSKLPEPVLKAPLADILGTKLPTQLNPMASHNSEAALNPAFPAVNQLLQQTQAAGNLNSQANQFWQMMETANSAANGRLLPLANELSEAITIDTNESLPSIFEESNASQSQGLSNTTITSSSTASTSEVHVHQPVGQAKWGGEFSQKVVWLTSQQQQVAEIHLNPAHLGPVEVMLTITQDQATAQFLSPHSAVREAIEQALPKLREMMAENGIQLGNVMVGSDSFQQENRQQHAGHSDRGNPHVTDSAQSKSTNQIEAIAAPTRHQGIVNTYA